MKSPSIPSTPAPANETCSLRYALAAGLCFGCAAILMHRELSPAAETVSVRQGASSQAYAIIPPGEPLGRIPQNFAR
jgi:hypothetical protein